MCGVDSTSDELEILAEELDGWAAWSRQTFPDNLSMIREWEQRARSRLPYLLSDNRQLTAEQLQDIASDLSPGGVHNGASFLLSLLEREDEVRLDPILIAALLAWNWQGGKAGFQFLPDPIGLGVTDYAFNAESLIDRIKSGCEGDPLRILTGEDARFYRDLPDRFTVYRGCSGIGAEVAMVGVCWTLERKYAEWFASRWRKDPVLVTARVSKADVALAFASEGGEIVVLPKAARQLKCRRRARRPL